MGCCAAFISHIKNPRAAGIPYFANFFRKAFDQQTKIVYDFIGPEVRATSNLEVCMIVASGSSVMKDNDVLPEFLDDSREVAGRLYF
jgi:hypothetical protein